MKFSVAVSVLILAAAAGLGWHDHQRLASVRGNHAQLVGDAAAHGIFLNSAHPQEGARLTKRARENREAGAKLAAAEFIAFAREMETLEKTAGRSGEATAKCLMKFMDRLMSLDAAQLKVLISEVGATTEIKDETRRDLLGFLITTLANDQPQAAIALFTESSGLFKNSPMGEHVISSALTGWAKDDPTGALEWVRNNGAKFPDFVTEDAKQGLIAGTAAQAPGLAFQLIAELGLKDSDRTLHGIVGAAGTPEQRTATLLALREHLATFTDEKARDEAASKVTRLLARGAAQDGFEAGSQWIAHSNFPPQQLEGIAAELANSVKRDETGQWIGWIGETLPAGNADESIRNLVNNWTQNDYLAAGKWLAAAPDGPVKNTSIRSYAETVSRYEPESAAQWALTLPPGKDRDETLRTIHKNWPKGDPASAAFAKEHGIE